MARRIDLYRFPEIRDLRDHWEGEKVKRTTTAATPLSPTQLAHILRSAPPAVSAVCLLMSTGSVRHIELMRGSTRLMQNSSTSYSLTRLPKRGRELRTATVPLTLTTSAILEKVTNTDGTLRVASLATVNAVIRATARRCGWAPGRYSTYSTRHGAITQALRDGVDVKDIKLQTAHASRIPQTYLRHVNADMKVQYKTAIALLGKSLLTPVSDSEAD
jgi:hypothetical protein